MTRRCLTTIAALTISSSVINGQHTEDTAKYFKDALGKLAVMNTPLPPEQKRQAVAATMHLLQQAISFRDDGIAASSPQISTLSPGIEWKNLKIRKIEHDTISESDTANGIRARYNAWLTCDMHRVWDKRANSWSEWRQGGYAAFSSCVRIIENANGSMEATNYTLGKLKGLSNATTPEAQTPQGTIRRTSGGIELPPGVYKK